MTESEATSTTTSEARTGDSPETAVHREQLEKKNPVQRFNFVVHEAVQKLFSRGIWVHLGPRFGGLQVRLRPFHVGAVVAKREAAERAVRVRLGLNDSDEIPAEAQIEITRAAITMAVTDVNGRVNAGDPGIDSSDPEIMAGVEGIRTALQRARDAGFKVEEDDGEVLIVFEPLTKASADEHQKHAEKVRRVFAPLLEASITLLTQLFSTSRALQRVRDEEIYRLGEAYVYGRPGEFDWAD